MLNPETTLRAIPRLTQLRNEPRSPVNRVIVTPNRRPPTGTAGRCARQQVDGTKFRARARDTPIQIVVK